MRFELTEDQRDFRAALDDLLSAADTLTAARAWAEGDHALGLGLWKRLADLGLNGLLVEGGTHVDLAVAHEALGHHLAVGPWIETAALSRSYGERVAAGELLTVAAPDVSYALDADVAALVAGTAGERLESIDVTRRLFRVEGGFEARRLAPQPPMGDFEVAALACAAQLLGAGERVLSDTVTYVQQRRQFGREIGSFQAVKHQLADVRIALDFARPLIYGAALSVSASSSSAARDTSAAKAYASDAAWKAARTALQLHGAVGYTRELDLGLWILRIRALCSAWGTPTSHRARVLESLVQR